LALQSLGEIPIREYLTAIFLPGLADLPVSRVAELTPTALAARSELTSFAGIVAAPIWLLFYLPCHLLIPRSSVLWPPRVCIFLGAVAGEAAFWVKLSFTTWGGNLNSGPWILNEAILAACVGACICLAGSMIAKRSMKKEKRILVVGSEQR
jgi:hypothetical protein